MKKLFVFALVCALVMSLVIPVFAATGSLDSKETAPKPELVSSTCQEVVNYTLEEKEALPQEAQEIFEESWQNLPSVSGEWTLRYFFYTDVCGNCPSCRVEFRVGEESEWLVKQFIDGKWVEMVFALNADGSISVEGLIDGPIAFWVRKLFEDPTEATAAPSYPGGSPSASKKDLKPILVSASCEAFEMYTTADAWKLAQEVQEIFREAKEILPEVVPEGMLVRYFFYGDICEICEDSTIVFRMDSHAEVLVMQYIGDQWVELESAQNADETITVEGVADGPMAILVK